jgi:hypothetical protein
MTEIKTTGRLIPYYISLKSVFVDVFEGREIQTDNMSFLYIYYCHGFFCSCIADNLTAEHQ